MVLVILTSWILLFGIWGGTVLIGQMSLVRVGIGVGPLPSAHIPHCNCRIYLRVRPKDGELGPVGAIFACDIDLLHSLGQVTQQAFAFLENGDTHSYLVCGGSVYGGQGSVFGSGIFI